MRTIIDRTTSAAQSATFALGADPRYYKPSVPFTIYLLGVLAGSEKITVEFPDGNDWRTAKIGGEDVQLDEDNTLLTLYGPLTFRLNKTSSSAAAGAAISMIQGV